jgi:adenine phosphoribosyltransferase
MTSLQLNSTAPFLTAPCTAHAAWIFDFLEPAPDFPSPGVLFQWYGPLLRNPKAFRRAIQEFAKRYQHETVDAVIGIESRGFIFAAALAFELGIPFVPVRKPGKLPGQIASVSYEKEYGLDCLQIECTALKPNDSVVIIDDVVATGGTSLAAGQLVEQVGANVLEIACMIELSNLPARMRIPYSMFSLLSID